MSALPLFVALALLMIPCGGIIALVFGLYGLSVDIAIVGAVLLLSAAAQFLLANLTLADWLAAHQTRLAGEDVDSLKQLRQHVCWNEWLLRRLLRTRGIDIEVIKTQLGAFRTK